MKVQTEQSKFDTDEHILVCLSSSPSNAGNPDKWLIYRLFMV